MKIIHINVWDFFFCRGLELILVFVLYMYNKLFWRGALAV
jgi:hypothetical protein